MLSRLSKSTSMIVERKLSEETYGETEWHLRTDFENIDNSIHSADGDLELLVRLSWKIPRVLHLLLRVQDVLTRDRPNSIRPHRFVGRLLRYELAEVQE